MAGVTNVIKRVAVGALKPLRDLSLIFYDDLEFRAMSLPRIAAGTLTVIVGVTWYQLLFCGRSFEHFEALATLCGGVWAAYSFKKWTGRPREPRQDEEEGDEGDGTADRQ